MRHLLAISALALALPLVATSVAHADPVVSKTCAVSVEIPAGWKSAAQGDTVLTMQDPKGEVGVVMICSDKTDVKEILASLDKQVGKNVTDIKMGKDKPMSINGLDGIVSDGSGKAAGKDVLLSVSILKTLNKHAIITFAAVQADTMKVHGAEVLGMFKTLKPVK